MRVWAEGLLGLEAAVELLIGHGTWPARAPRAAGRAPAMTGDTRRGPSPEPAASGPELVRVIRPGHPLHGLDLPVWGRPRLRGAAMAVVVLPDGSKKRIPAPWTRAGGS